MAYYTNLEDIKRVLRSSDKEVVRFSDSLVSTKINKQDPSSDPMGFDDSEITYGPSFDDKLKLKFDFKSPSEFDLYKVTSSVKHEQLIEVSVDATSDLEIFDGDLTINSGAWFGNIESGDEVILTFDPHMSNHHANNYIEDVEVEIDSMLMEAGVDNYEGFQSRLFSQGSVPPQVEVAATYLTAYYIFTDVFASVYKDGSPETNYSGRWKNRAEKYMERYITSENLSAPYAKSFPRYIDKVGVPDQGPGMSKMTEDDSEVNRDAQTEKIFKRQHIVDMWDYNLNSGD